MSNKMWTAFEQYQPYADAQSHGESWRRMTTERTPSAIRAAYAAAWATDTAADAVDAARAAYAEEAAAAAARHEARAIRYIKKAIKEAQP